MVATWPLTELHLMRQLDRITELKPGESLTAVKSLTLAEEYLQDHFPVFPVMPGALMLEAMYQAAAWLTRHDDDFAHSLVLLKEARNVKYSGFVRPGQTLQVTAELQSRDERTSKFKAKGTIDGELAVSAKIVVEHYSLADEDPRQKTVDAHMRERLRRELKELQLPLDATANAQVGAG